MLGRVNVHVDQGRIEFQVQHEGRVSAVIEHIPVGLANRVADQPVLDDASVYKEMLQMRENVGSPTQPHSFRPSAAVSM